MDTTELKRLYDEWQAMEATTEWVGEHPWQKQITYNPKKSITTRLFSAYLQEVEVDTCTACHKQALLIPAEVNGFCLQYATAIETTIEWSIYDHPSANESGIPASVFRPDSLHYATDCLNCGNRMLFRKSFVETKIEKLVGKDS